MNNRICDLPKKLFEDIYPYIGWHTLGFFSRAASDIEEKPMLIGSGTLIQLDKYRGILTANHVAKAIAKSHEIIVAVTQDQKEIVKFKRENILIDTIGVSKDTDAGPDIALVTIHQSEMGYINSKKSYINLEKHKENALKINENIEVGIWLLSGFPGEKETVYRDEKLDKMVENVILLCTTTHIPEYNNNDDFDYFNIVAIDSDEKSELSSYGGFSGGGVWRTLIKREEESIVVHSSPEYLGVPFLQSFENSKIVIRAHGPKTIYSVVYDYIINKFL